MPIRRCRASEKPAPAPVPVPRSGPASLVAVIAGCSGSRPRKVWGASSRKPNGVEPYAWLKSTLKSSPLATSNRTSTNSRPRTAALELRPSVKLKSRWAAHTAQESLNNLPCTMFEALRTSRSQSLAIDSRALTGIFRGFLTSDRHHHHDRRFTAKAAEGVARTGVGAATRASGAHRLGHREHSGTHGADTPPGDRSYQTRTRPSRHGDHVQDLAFDARRRGDSALCEQEQVGLAKRSSTPCAAPQCRVAPAAIPTCRKTPFALAYAQSLSTTRLGSRVHTVSQIRVGETRRRPARRSTQSDPETTFATWRSQVSCLPTRAAAATRLSTGRTNPPVSRRTGAVSESIDREEMRVRMTFNPAACA